MCKRNTYLQNAKRLESEDKMLEQEYQRVIESKDEENTRLRVENAKLRVEVAKLNVENKALEIQCNNSWIKNTDLCNEIAELRCENLEIKNRQFINLVKEK